MRNKGSPVPYRSTLPQAFDGEEDGEHGEHQNDGRNGLPSLWALRPNSSLSKANHFAKEKATGVFPRRLVSRLGPRFNP